MSEQKVNYTEAAVARLHKVYDGEADEATRDEQVKALAEELGKNVQSIRMKLTREGIYVAKAKAPAGKASVSKAQIVTAIAAKLEVTEDVIGSLEKANKVALVRIYNAL
jgi:hypothetical protein